MKVKLILQLAEDKGWWEGQGGAAKTAAAEDEPPGSDWVHLHPRPCLPVGRARVSTNCVVVDVERRKTNSTPVDQENRCWFKYY